MPQQPDLFTKASGAPRLYTVPAGQSFLAELARAVLSGKLHGHGHRAPTQLELTDVTIVLPTQRAVRSLQEEFLAQSGQRALLMPRIRPIAEAEEDLTILGEAAGLLHSGRDDLALPPAIGPLERLLTLTTLVMRWSEATRSASDSLSDPIAGAGSRTPGQAAQLAAELAKLMDMLETEGVDLSRLAALVPEQYSQHWQQTLDFLQIVIAAWPHHLKERGLVSPMARRNLLIETEARRLRSMPVNTPVIVAGVTGTIPATAELIRSVMALPNGSIILPNLDTQIDDETWQAIRPSIVGAEHFPGHPQFGLKKLLDNLGVERSTVKPLGTAPLPPQAIARAKMFSEAMRPSASTGRWHGWAADARRSPAELHAALENVSILSLANSYDEAEAIALILREAVETPGQTAALVSPDRLLARRVAARLETWGIKVDDSAGRPFAKTATGTFLDLVINAAVSDFAPIDVMALLKHPLCRLGLEPFVVRRTARAIEIAAFRTPYLGRGADGIDAALERARHDCDGGRRRDAAARRVRKEDYDAAHDLIGRLRSAYAPLVALSGGSGRHTLQEIAAGHATTAETLSQTPPEETGKTASALLWQGEAGSAASTIFTGLMDASIPSPHITVSEYRDIYHRVISGENVRVRTAVHPRLSIWGPFEARLQQPDIVVLGSLNEGVWPEAADAGPWLNRPMRNELGLPSPEEKIGYAAHDVSCLLGAQKVYLTRAEKSNGVPTVPSRWLMRLDALLEGADVSHVPRRDARWQAWAAQRNVADRSKQTRQTAPEPRPPVALRPRKMSVTMVERWLRNPYAVYAQKILKLSPLPALGTPPGAALRGALVHEVLSDFAKRHSNRLPQDIEASLRVIAHRVLEDYTGNARVAAFWLPRLEQFITWFSHTEAQRRDGISSILAEVDGSTIVDACEGLFTLTARADRMDISGGSVIITDYKTGSLPKDNDVKTGSATQLPLEAAIALNEPGFTGVVGCKVNGLRYIRAHGGVTGGEERTVKADDIEALAAGHLDKLKALVQRYDNPATPYAAIRRPRFNYDYDDYAHLARVAEWSGHDSDVEDGL